MAEENPKNDLKSTIAQHKPRDQEGHFIHVEKPKDPKPSKNPIHRFFAENTHYSKGKDDLVDIHVGNPLGKITKLLQDIKKQKAFSFTLKGSLGIMGVFLALSLFGVLGGGQILCEKGMQTQIGVIKTLNVFDTPSATIPGLSFIIDYFSPPHMRYRTVLITENQTAIRLPYSQNVDLTKYEDYPVLATGSYDSCSQTLKVTDPSAIEIFVK